MMETVVWLIPYALPPLLGAVIGYVTNALAIRMLFRPLTEKRFLGVRIPFTPGIIPGQRHQLAHSIARMVSQKLLTEDILIARLHDPDFSDVLRASVARFTSDILHGTSRGPEETAGELRTGVAEITQGLLSSFFHSESFSDVVHRLAEVVVDGAFSTVAGRVLPEPSRLADLVSGGLESLARGPAAPAAELAVQRWVAGHMAEDTPLVAIIGQGSIARLAGTVPGLYEPVLESLLSFLRQPSTRGELSIHGRDLLGRVLRRLNLFQRFIVSATQYDRNLSENMPAVIDDLIESVERAGRDPQNRERLTESLQEQVHELGATGIRTLLERFDLHAERLVTRLFALTVELLGREDVRKRVTDGVVGFIEKHRDRTLGDLAGSLFGLEGEELSGRVVSVVDSWVARDDNVDRLADDVCRFIGGYFGRSDRRRLGDVLPLGADQKARIDSFLTARLQALVERRIPEVITGLDVYTMVVAKIDGLDIESVEQLLLMVIARHLKWINLFGAVLGSLIGGVQVVIGLLT